MTRKEQIKTQAENIYYGSNEKPGFGDLVIMAEWADLNPHESITELIHQRSIAFDEAKKFQAKLAIAVDALKQIPLAITNPEVDEIAKEALSKIEVLK